LGVRAGLLVALSPINAFGVSEEVDVGEGEGVFVGVELNGVVEADTRLRGCALCGCGACGGLGGGFLLGLRGGGDVGAEASYGGGERGRLSESSALWGGLI